MFRRQFVSISVLMLTLTACGFHLRGNIPLPAGMDTLFVKAPTGSFKNKLEQVLQNAGATIATSKAGAKATIQITKMELSNEVGTLDERGKANSYTLVLMVSYKLVDPEGIEHRQANLVERRRYNFNPEQVIESESEERELKIDMEQSIALRIIRQLSVMADYPTIKSSEPTSLTDGVGEKVKTGE